MMKTFFIINIGCSKRRVDCERIKNYFLANHLKQVASPEHANWIIISTCGLSEFHEHESIKAIVDIQTHSGSVIVYGCLSTMNRQKLESVFNSHVIPLRNIERFDEVFPDFAIKFADIPDANHLYDETAGSAKNKLKRRLQQRDLYYPLKLYNAALVGVEQLRKKVHTLAPKLFPRPFINRMPIFLVDSNDTYFTLRIAEGCLGNCSYCSIKYSIGRLKSKPIPLLMEELRQGINKGHYKINVLSSDAGAYGLDIGATMPELFNAVLDMDQRITIDYVEDLHPSWLCQYREELLDLIQTKRIRSILIPIQSGSSRILKLMNRTTDLKTYYETIIQMKKLYPKLRLRTYVIVGFPTETEGDVAETIDFLLKCRFDEVDMLQYFETAKMDSVKITPKVPKEIIMTRMQRIQASLPKQTITHTLYDGLRKNRVFLTL